MTYRWEWLWMQFSRRLWVRAALISLLAVLAVASAGLLRDYIPEDFAARIGADSVDSILAILASSMLAVTTFSLTTMVSAYGAATSHAQPGCYAKTPPRRTCWRLSSAASCSRCSASSRWPPGFTASRVA